MWKCAAENCQPREGRPTRTQLNRDAQGLARASDCWRSLTKDASYLPIRTSESTRSDGYSSSAHLLHGYNIDLIPPLVLLLCRPTSPATDPNDGKGI